MRSAQALKRVLTDPVAVVVALGLHDDMRRQQNSVLMRCPSSSHYDSNPSCSVGVRGGHLAWFCFGCGTGGDVFHLIAEANELDVKRDFLRVLDVAAELADGLLRPTARASSTRSLIPTVASYPDATEVAKVWNNADPLEHDSDAARWCLTRQLDAAHLDDWDLARVISRRKLPSWAAMRGQAWPRTGHTVIVPTYDAAGAMRSLRARAIGRETHPKELSPRGHQMKGLVLANVWARRMLHGTLEPSRVLITEGTPDYLTWSVRVHYPLIGILGSVGLPPDVADKIPDETRVAVRVDRDLAGLKYESTIVRMLGGRCDVVVLGDDA